MLRLVPASPPLRVPMIPAPGHLLRFRLPPWVGRAAISAFAIVPLGFFVLMAMGLVHWYSPVPFWDMWDGYITGFVRYLDGEWRGLFAQANEHRIWFSNILFFLDLAVFGGRSVLLVAANAVLALAVWGLLALIARHLLSDIPGLWPVTALAIGPLCLSWLQEPNLTWGFQSQFFLAYLFPLAAFASLAVSQTSKRSTAWFAAAVALGLGAMVTMANGLFALPMIVAMMLLLRRPAGAGLVLALTVVATVAWFHDYLYHERPRADPQQFATFVLTFFGLPVSAMFEHLTKTFAGAVVMFAWAGQLAGLFFLAAATVLALRWLWRRDRARPMELALLVFIAYIGASCAVIALGRAPIQPNAALVSRYATPSLIAWAALSILIVHAFRRVPFAPLAVAAIGIIGAYGLFPAQLRALSDAGPESVHRKLVGALALKMRVPDLGSIGQIYPTDPPDYASHIHRVAAMAEAKQVSIMGDPLLAAAAASMGQRITDVHRPCAGALDLVEPIPGVASHLRAVGWIFDRQSGRVPSFALLAADGVIAGVAATGLPRRDVAEAVDARARNAGFTGFVGAAVPPGALTLYCGLS